MRTLCFGGSFNPIHHGHLICARAVAESGGFDRIRLIPSAAPPHKLAAADMADAGDRLSMCQIASFGHSDLFEIDDLELRRIGPSFTIDTVRELRATGMDQINWLIGSDTIAHLPTWRQPAELLAAVNFVIMARPGTPVDWSAIPPAFQRLQHQMIVAPQIDISATNIRDRVRQRRSIAFLTPPAVAEYIAQHRLYV